MCFQLGQDCGGLTREWISVLSAALFDPKNELFTQFNKDDKQALVCVPCFMSFVNYIITASRQFKKIQQKTTRKFKRKNKTSS